MATMKAAIFVEKNRIVLDDKPMSRCGGGKIEVRFKGRNIWNMAHRNWLSIDSFQFYLKISFGVLNLNDTALISNEYQGNERLCTTQSNTQFNIIYITRNNMFPDWPGCTQILKRSFPLTLHSWVSL